MKKSIVLCSVFLFFFGLTGFASATPLYEYYSGYQSVKEGKSYGFYFDLVFRGEYTDSSLTMQNDVATGLDSLPYKNAFVKIKLYSGDKSSEKVDIDLTAYFDNTQYNLYHGWFEASEKTDPHQTFIFDISDTSFINDPWGDITIMASFTGLLHYNDFGIKEVGIGGTPAPVPEPGTMLLLGMGLLGFGVVSRKKFFKK